VAKLTAVSATRLSLGDRGVLREGALADIVVFDPATVADIASYEQPSLHPLGIDDVIVNGRIAVRDGVETGTRAGRLLRRTG
jgi:N-acyl-D-aspartate/D-glutamate deacylase